MTNDAVDRPHLLENECDLMHQEMSAAASYLEFGAGGSTVFATQIGIPRIVSVDSDPAWIGKIGAQIDSARNSQVDLLLCDLGRTGEWGMPLDRDRMTDWPDYFVRPWEKFLSRKEIPDLIYVDGRFRVACALYSMLVSHLSKHAPADKRPRIMIHDFSDRSHYRIVLDFASVVASANTLIVLKQNADISPHRLVCELLSFQFDPR